MIFRELKKGNYVKYKNVKCRIITINKRDKTLQIEKENGSVKYYDLSNIDISQSIVLDILSANIDRLTQQQQLELLNMQMAKQQPKYLHLLQNNFKKKFKAELLISPTLLDKL